MRNQQLFVDFGRHTLVENWKSSCNLTGSPMQADWCVAALAEVLSLTMIIPVHTLGELIKCLIHANCEFYVTFQHSCWLWKMPDTCLTCEAWLRPQHTAWLTLFFRQWMTVPWNCRITKPMDSVYGCLTFLYWKHIKSSSFSSHCPSGLWPQSLHIYVRQRHRGICSALYS